MALAVSAQVIRLDILDTPFVDVAGRYVTGGDQVAQPLRGVRIDLVVVGAHAGPIQAIGCIDEIQPMGC
ncbi:hypothetical protein [Burkholderia stagnalis]|uniref:hypothetical protein n=1 Tax=Burkholderia stagnalis TaxID=1503054 RepID=UPI0021AB3FDE|nr:hypothetical protein [Burkholderia stagnalis]